MTDTETKLEKYIRFKGMFETVEVFEESSHLDRKLVRVKENPDELYLYEWYEYVDFSGGKDSIYETFTKVRDEEDARQLNNRTGDIRRTPYYRIMPDYTILEG